MAVPSIISAEQYHDIFGSSEEENNTVDSDGSDIDVQEVESDLEEDESDSESDNDSNASDTIEWSDELEDFDIDEFSGRQEMKFNVPDNVSANDFFSQLFVELFGATEKTYRHVPRTSFAKARKSELSETNSYLQNGMTREIYLSCRQMFCQVSLPMLFHDKGTAEISTLRSLV